MSYHKERCVVGKANVEELISENPRLLLLLEHFGIDFKVGGLSVEQLCRENGVPLQLFLTIANLYNGFAPTSKESFTVEEIPYIINFLTHSHRYYKEDKYPEIVGYIEELHERLGSEEVLLIERFFKSYFAEVVEHLDYEDKVAFPYFLALAESGGAPFEHPFSAEEYRLHHTDIETKLADLKSLLMRHISLKGELALRRKLLFALQELEYDLSIHDLIEEGILLPIAERVEGDWSDKKGE